MWHSHREKINIQAGDFFWLGWRGDPHRVFDCAKQSCAHLVAIRGIACEPSAVRKISYKLKPDARLSSRYQSTFRYKRNDDQWSEEKLLLTCDGGSVPQNSGFTIEYNDDVIAEVEGFISNLKKKPAALDIRLKSHFSDWFLNGFTPPPPRK